MISDAALTGHAAAVNEYLRAKSDAVPHRLTPIMALHEVIAVCEAIRAGHQPPQPQDRRTLTGDTQEALQQLGKELRRMLAPTLDDYLKHLVQLPKLLDDGAGSLHLLHASRVLLDHLRQPACSAAAYRDLVAAARNGKDPETGLLRAAQLREIEESLGHKWDTRKGALIAAFSGNGLDQAEDQLHRPVDDTATVAWFIFTHADLENGYLRIGQIQFFSHRLWPHITDAQMMARLPDAELPAELGPDILPFLRPSPPINNLEDPPSNGPAGPEETTESATRAVPPHVYARVELSGPRAQGCRNPQAHGRPQADWARELVRGVVDAATFGRGGSRWRLLNGYAVYHGTPGHDGAPGSGWTHTVGFRDPDDLRPEDLLHPLREGTGIALEAMPTEFIQALAQGDPAAQDAVNDARWHLSTRRQVDAAQRVVLHVRAFEQALPLRSGETWYQAVRHFLRQRWALQHFGNHLLDLAWASYHLLPAPQPQIGGFLIHHGDAFTVNRHALLRSAQAIADALPSSQPLWRMRARAAAKWARDPIAAREHLQQHERQFDTLLNRALRQRNAVVHGVRTVPAVVATVDDFVARLSAYVIGDAVRRVATGQDLGEVLEQRRAAARRALWRLEQPGADTADVLNSG